MLYCGNCILSSLNERKKNSFLLMFSSVYLNWKIIIMTIMLSSCLRSFLVIYIRSNLKTQTDTPNSFQT